MPADGLCVVCTACAHGSPTCELTTLRCAALLRHGGGGVGGTQHTHNRNIGSNMDDAPPVTMQADYASLKHLTTELQAALQEANSYHQRRLARYIK